MKTKRKTMMLLLAATLAAGSANAQDLKFPRSLWDAEMLGMASSEAIVSGSARPSIDPAPTTSSATTRNELNFLRKLQDGLRTPDTVAHIRMEADISDPSPFIEAGLLPSFEQAPTFHEMLAIGFYDVSGVTLREQLANERPRPTQLDEGLTSVIPMPRHSSYPSLQAARIHFLEGFMSALAPSCSGAYKVFADNISKNREIAGVNFPSDTSAGRQVANWYLSKLGQHPSWESMAPQAAAELQAFTASSGCPRY